jgi:hypothetical protein
MFVLSVICFRDGVCTRRPISKPMGRNGGNCSASKLKPFYSTNQNQVSLPLH